MSEKVSRRWFLKATGASGIGLGSVLSLFWGASAEERPPPVESAPVEPMPVEPPDDSYVDKYTRVRRYPLGLGATEVAPGHTAIVSANPQRPFRPTRLITPSKGLVLRDVRVGIDSVFVNPVDTAVPVEVFSPDAVAIHFDAGVAVPGVSVSVVVENVTSRPQTFYGVMLGDTVVGAS
jgi:hypothetical protein